MSWENRSFRVTAMTYYRNYTVFFFYSGLTLLTILAFIAVIAFTHIDWKSFSAWAIAGLSLLMIRHEIWMDKTNKQIGSFTGIRYLFKPVVYSFDQIVRLRTERHVVPTRFNTRTFYSLYAEVDPTSIGGIRLLESNEYQSVVSEGKFLALLANCPLVEGSSLQEIRNELGPPL